MRQVRRGVDAVSDVTGFEIGSDGLPVGRDPREMTREELAELGHYRMSPMDVIRARCLDCCADQQAEVRKCTSVRCPSWPFRMGKNPWRDVSEAQRANGRRLAEKSQLTASAPSAPGS